MGTDSFVQVAIDGAGKKIRNFFSVIGADTVYQQVVTLAKSDGTLIENSSIAVTAASLPLPTGAAKDTSLANLDVALSTRTKPADQQHAIIDSGTLTAVTAITNPLPAGTNVLGHVVTDTGSTVSVSNLTADQLVHATNLDVAVSTLLKPADTLTKVATLDTITNPVGVSILTSPLDVQQNGGNPWGVTQSTTPWVVSGPFYQTTQPVSLTGEGLESLRTQRAMIGRSTLRPKADKLRRMGLHA